MFPAAATDGMRPALLHFPQQTLPFVAVHLAQHCRVANTLHQGVNSSVRSQRRGQRTCCASLRNCTTRNKSGGPPSGGSMYMEKTRSCTVRNLLTHAHAHLTNQSLVPSVLSPHEDPLTRHRSHHHLPRPLLSTATQPCQQHHWLAPTTAPAVLTQTHCRCRCHCRCGWG